MMVSFAVGNRLCGWLEGPCRSRDPCSTSWSAGREAIQPDFEADKNVLRTRATEIATELGRTGRDGAGPRTFANPEGADNSTRFRISGYAARRPRSNYKTAALPLC